MNGDEIMRQLIPFVKDINFTSKLSEVTSISLEHNLIMENNDSIVGNFTVSGKYKINEISINEESFNEKIDFDITLDDKYDSSKISIDIDNFYYEIINEENLRLHIDVLIDNLEYMKKEEVVPKLPIEIEDEIIPIDDLNIDIRNNNQKQESEERIDIKKDITLDSSFDVNEITSNLTSSFLAGEEHFSTYKIHIIREEEKINTVMEKYKISKDELEKYNTLDNVMLGTKIIIPIKDEE